MSKKANYYIIGGQYYFYCYGSAETMTGAKRIAGKHDEYWDNWQGWHRPSIYKAEDCILADTQFHGEQMIPAEGAHPVAVYDMDHKMWYNPDAWQE